MRFFRFILLLNYNSINIMNFVVRFKPKPGCLNNHVQNYYLELKIKGYQRSLARLNTIADASCVSRKMSASWA